MKAFLILENGVVFEGTSIGALKEVISEIVFTTSMVGYVEQLTDPSYMGQSVCMTYPLIGNYGVCKEDMESEKIWVSGYIVRELSRLPGNFRSELTIQEFLLEHGVPGIAGIDTRALTKLLREKGTMNGMITTNASYDREVVLQRLKAFRVGTVVEAVSVSAPYTVGAVHGKKKSVAVWDFGAKRNIIRSLAKRGCDVTVYPAGTDFSEIEAAGHDGVMLSNGPGDPKECGGMIRQIARLYESGIPTFAICLGHQLMALAAGLDTHKLKYGHRGGNHPVQDLVTGKVYISSQNHGYVVDVDGLSETVAVPAFRNVNDGTNEGLSYTGRPVYTVQFHPEACPGPQDTGFLFDRFIQML